MPPSDSQGQRARIGVPYRIYNEQVKGVSAKHAMYLRAVEAAGGMAIPVELDLSPSELQRRMKNLDAVVLPGSPADVDAARYRSARHAKTADADERRETTDLTLLRHCFSEGKPVLAICYGVQILNVYLGGSLIQDIPTEVQTTIQHSWTGRERGEPEPIHKVVVAPANRLALESGDLERRVNSSHHQALRDLGRGLRVTARASDGIVEAVEWTGDSNWVTGVQWHPERMMDDTLAQRLFEDLVEAARSATVRG
jgi:putative glutamine amidotransferase